MKLHDYLVAKIGTNNENFLMNLKCHIQQTSKKVESVIQAHLPQAGYISLKDMLEHLPIKRSTVWKWVKTEKFPSPVKIHTLTRWRVEEVNAWLAQFTDEAHQTQERHSYGE